MPSIDEIFSVENLVDYGKVCLDLAWDVPHLKNRRDFDTLVIPSRGAVPFFLGMIYALKKIRDDFDDPVYTKFYDTLAVQPNLESLLHPDCKLNSDLNKSNVRVLLIPFTADLNVNKMDPPEDNDEYVKKTRGYWANVTSSFFKTPKERKRDPYFLSFTDTVLRGIENRSDVSKVYENFPQIRRGFSIIDTVISGRASNDILRSFDGLSIRLRDPRLIPSAFLVVDHNGFKLETTFFKPYLVHKESKGEVRMYPVPRIVSEDKGASLLGVSAVVYPSVMRDSKKLELAGSEFFVGAGSWYFAADLGTDFYKKSFDKFINLIYRAVDLGYDFDLNRDDRREQESFSALENAREDFINFAMNEKILSVYDANVSPLCLSYPVKESYETRSHVVHVIFGEDVARKVTDKLKELPGVY